MSLHFEKVFVITMHKGLVSAPSNVCVISVGKEKGRGKLACFFAFYKAIWNVLTKNKVNVCFAHMMPLFLVMGWPMLKFAKVPCALWYAHKSDTKILRLAHFFSDQVFTSSKEGYPIKGSSKVVYMGQTVAKNAFIQKTNKSSQKNAIVSFVGRISPIKNQDILIGAIAILTNTLPGLKFIFVGKPVNEEGVKYKAYLKNLIHNQNLDKKIDFLESVAYSQIFNVYKNSLLTINLSPKGAWDKVVVESLYCSTPVIYYNSSFDELYRAAGVRLEKYKLQDLSSKCLAEKIMLFFKTPRQAISSDTSLLKSYISKSYDFNEFIQSLANQLKGIV